MSATEQLHPSPIRATVANPGEWEQIANHISSEAGEPTTLSLEIVTAMIGSAVPLLFAADATKDMNPLRGAFSDAVIAQCERNAGCLLGAKPLSVGVELVGAPLRDGHPTLRAHLSIDTEEAAGEQGVLGQFWDLQVGAQVTVGQASCPNCGAPIADGALICEHCHTDVRALAAVPLLVSRLEAY